MGYAMREIQHFINTWREPQSKRIIESLSRSIPDAQQAEAGLLRSALIWGPDKIEQQPAQLNGMALERHSGPEIY